MRVHFLALGAVAGIGFASVAGAGTITPPDLEIQVQMNGSQIWQTNPSGQPETPGNTEEFRYVGETERPEFDLTWDVFADVDPIVQSVIGFTNNGANTALFTVVTQLPISPAITPASLMGGSVGGSVTDANGDGLGGVNTIAGSSIFAGMIDGAVVSNARLLTHSFTSDPFLFGGDTNNIPASDFGLPGPTEPGPAALNSIGIQLEFELSPGDSVAISSFFQVEIPSPGSASLLGVSALFAARRRRR